MEINKNLIDKFITDNYPKVESLKLKFKTWQTDNVEDAFQVSYYNLIMNIDSLEVTKSVEATVMSYLHTSMSNKLKTYKRNSAYLENVDFVDSQTDDCTDNSYVMEFEQEDTYEQIDTKLALEALKERLSDYEYQLIYRVYAEGVLVNHLAVEHNTTYYTMNARINSIMAKAEKFLK